MGVLNDTMMMGASAAGGYEIDNSLRFNDDDSAYLSRTPSVAGNRKTWTWSGWVKRGNLGTYQWLVGAGASGTSRSMLMFWGDAPVDGLLLYYTIGSGTYGSQTDAIFRDPSAWYHIAIAVDTTQGTAANRAKIYVNGEQQTTTAYSTGYIPQNTDLHINNNQLTTIGRKTYSAGDSLDGYLSEVNFIDGLALTPDSFGETGDYGEWKPLRYTGAYGTNGFYLDFADSGNLGKDLSINANNWTPTNLAATDQMLDSPTNNFCTLNPLHIVGTVLSEGNVKSTATGVAGGCASQGTIGILNTKTYFEVLVVSNSGGLYIGTTTTAGTTPLVDRGSGICFGASSQIIEYGAFVTYGAAWVVGDIIGVSVDSVNGTMEFFINNVGQGTITNSTISSKYHYPFDIYYSSTGSSVTVANFGQDSSFAGNKVAQGNSDSNGIGDFYYAPPAGFLALCTQNLPDPTVIPSEHFNTVLYTGTGAAQSITGAGFQPDFTWIKARTGTGQHGLVDAVRGRAKSLRSNGTDTENTSTATQDVTSFDADGFSLGTEYNISCNANGVTHVAWNWKANGTGVSNTDGTITSTVSANVDAGFSIISYTGNGGGATVGHGLTLKEPDLIIVKSRTQSAENWSVYSSAFTTPATGNMFLDGTNAVGTSTAVWNNTEATSTVFSVGHAGVNASAEDYIAYAFHSVDGYSKVGSYTGNGSADGTFVHCGFRPAYVMVKRTDAARDWITWDNERDGYNVTDTKLSANTSSAEYQNAVVAIDFTSNGFKLRGTDEALNASGGTYIYLAFAESPFKHSNAR